MKLQQQIINIENRLKKINSAQMNALVQELYDKNPDNFIMIKLGANDGWMCDNLYDFVMKNDPHSIMIEPIPCYFKTLKENFSSLKNIKYENIAIDTVKGVREMNYIPDEKFQRGEVDFRLKTQPELFKEHWARGLGSFYKDKNNLGCPELSQHAVTIEVETATIDDIYDKYNITDKHNVVVVTDLEGHDHEILKAFNFNKYNPDMYISEIELFTRYPRSHPRRQNYINEQMNPNARLPPPGEAGFEAWVNFDKVPVHCMEHIERNNLRDESNVQELWQYMTNLVTSGMVPLESGYPYLSYERPHELEYQQQYGLYTPEEFKNSVEIFESNGYTVLRQSGEDMVAIKTELFKNSTIIQENF